ncbi:hypothetical protein ACH4N4_05265 [Streptomyces microflavus]|uniref:hypothetical protein n=1 Tax=Streptomyces microflavus TaxID=1919 RepID=UPI00378D9442
MQHTASSMPATSAKTTGMLVHRCTICHDFHIGDCEDAAIERMIWDFYAQSVRAAFTAALQPRTSMADVPPALRGPRWQEERRQQ